MARIPVGPEVDTFARGGGPSVAANLGGIGAAYGALADLGGQLHDAGEQALIPQMEAKGAAQVSTDPDTGEIKVQDGNHLVLNRLDAALEHGKALAFHAQSEANQYSAFADLASRNPTDPDLFKAGANAYLKEQVAKAPMPFKADLMMTGQRQIAQHVAGITNKRIALDQERFENSTKSLIDMKSNEWTQLVAQPGGAETPQAQQLHQEIGNLYSALADNPLTGFTREQAESGMRHLESRAKLEAGFRQLDKGAVGLATLEAAIQDPAMGFTPDQVVQLTNRAEAVQRDNEVKQARAEAMVRQQAAQQSDETLKGMYDLKAGGRLTSQIIMANRAKMNAADYGVAFGMLKSEGVERDNPGTVADLVLAKADTPVDEYKGTVAQALRRGEIKWQTANELLNQNAAAQRDDRPASPYRQGRDYVKNSLDVNPFIIGNDFGTRKQTQANALTEFDTWAQQHPQATADEHLAQAQGIVSRYSAAGAVSTPGTLGTPYGFAGALSRVTDQDILAAALRLNAALKAGRVSQATFNAETARLTGWKSFLTKAPLQPTKVP